MVASAAIQHSEVIKLPVLTERLNKYGAQLLALFSHTDLPNESRLIDVIEDAEACFQSLEVETQEYKWLLKKLVHLAESPQDQTIDQLEALIAMTEEVGQLLNAYTRNIEDLFDSRGVLDSHVTRMSRQGQIIDSAVKNRITKNVRKIVTIRDDAANLRRHWRGELLTMKLLGEPGQRRPLTTKEKILFTNAAVIYTPVVQDPSDSREDWYEYDGSQGLCGRQCSAASHVLRDE